MTDYILSIDPGVSTGIALIGYEPDSAPTLAYGTQFTGGVIALIRWVNEHYDDRYWDSYNDQPNYRGFYGWKMGVGEALYTQPSIEYAIGTYEAVQVPANVQVISEKFTARNTKGFSYTTASLEPLRGEGALIALGLMPDYDPKEKRWRDPSLQYLVGGKDLANKKKRQHSFLKDIGFYRTNKDFPEAPAKDGADDARSAMAHALSYLIREVRHRPTHDLVSRWVADD